jgi:hypothetical protein
MSLAFQQVGQQACSGRVGVCGIFLIHMNHFLIFEISCNKRNSQSFRCPGFPLSVSFENCGLSKSGVESTHPIFRERKGAVSGPDFMGKSMG